MNARHGVALAALVAAALCGPAWAVNEVEPNNSMAEAKELPIDAAGAVALDGSIHFGEPDVFYFFAKAGDKVLVDIDNATIDTTISIHDATTYTILDSQGDVDTGVVDPGSDSAADPYFEFVAPNDGKYILVVTAYPSYMDGNGAFQGPPIAGPVGDYTLNVTGALPQVVAPPAEETPPSEETPPNEETPPSEETPPTGETPQTGEAVKVAIDVFPGQRWFTRRDWKRRDLIPVAILSSRTFDPRSLDVSTLTFGATGDEQSLRHCTRTRHSLNRDRRPDMICFFRAEQAGFGPSSERGVLRGLTTSGTSVEGTAMLKSVPEKKKHKHYGDHHRHDHKQQSHNSRSRWYR
jgi:hypothetical protein